MVRKTSSLKTSYIDLAIPLIIHNVILYATKNSRHAHTITSSRALAMTSLCSIVYSSQFIRAHDKSSRVESVIHARH
jgi:hypothetical protein